MNRTERTTRIVLAARDEYLRRKKRNKRIVVSILFVVGIISVGLTLNLLKRDALYNMESGGKEETANHTSTALNGEVIQPYNVVNAHIRANGVVVEVEKVEKKNDGCVWEIKKDNGEEVPVIDVTVLKENDNDTADNTFFLRTEEIMEPGNYLISNGFGDNKKQYELQAGENTDTE